MIFEKFMRRAMELAANGIGFTSPNPVVGAVVVKEGEIVAEGWHKKAGNDHAEIIAIKNLSVDAADCELYVTLEPCSHHGKTGPCAKAIVEAGFKKVYIGMLDPFPEVNGRGVEFLRLHGVEVEICDEKNDLVKDIHMLNQPFLKYVKTGLPYIVLKAGMSLDGAIATKTGDSKWITSEDARIDARLERSRCDAVLVGSGTVLADNCELAAHGIYSDKKLLRVVIGQDVDLSKDLKIFRDENVLVESAPVGKRVDLKALLRKLAEMGVRTVFVEGGSSVHGAFVDAALVDKAIFYMAPRLIGGAESYSVVGGAGAKNLTDSLELESFDSVKIGSDIKITALVNVF